MSALVQFGHAIWSILTQLCAAGGRVFSTLTYTEAGVTYDPVRSHGDANCIKINVLQQL